MDGPGDKLSNSDPEHSYSGKNGFNLYSSYPAPPSTAQTNSRRQQPSGNLNNGYGLGEGKVYEFDHVFDERATQEDVYRNTTAPLVKSVFEGFCATVFAYGATSSGKTHSMIGTQSDPGIMKRSIDDVFEMCSDPERESKAEVYLSYLEIYNEKIRDLLRPIPGVHLELREDTEQVHVSGLSEIRATSTNEVLNLLQKGNRARTMEPTAANVTSSRSHAVLLVTVRQFAQDDTEVTDGKLYLIDLAGSERASHTKNSGLRLREGGHINRSLLALGNCITALAAGDDKYINYRDSKLTRLLKAALGGPSKTVMIAHVSPSAHQREETRNTLLYGQRARAISNRVRKFIYPGQGNETSYIIDELRSEVKRLQTKLDQRNASPASSYSSTRNVYPSSHSVPLPLPTSITPNSGPMYHEGYIDKHERHELAAIKQQISSLFDEEFKLRNDLLKLDGAMLQSALDCEILRLMVLDWENLKSSRDSDKDENLEDIETERSEISTVMTELKQVRQEQDKLLLMRNQVEKELQRVRTKITQFEEEATQYLPEIQREILSLLCKLQQEQLNKMSIEIEAELKRRGSLLLRCLRQKALGEAIIHRQRHFISAISGRNLDSSHNNDRFLPPLTSPNNSKPNSGERVYTASIKLDSLNHLPPLGSASVPQTTKYSDFRQQRLIQRQLASSSEEDYEDKYERDRMRVGSPKKHKAKTSNQYASY